MTLQIEPPQLLTAAGVRTTDAPLTAIDRRIEPPPDFPVTWAEPELAALHWTRDREHMPDPITPMFSSVAALMATSGQERTHRFYEESIVHRHDRPINTYLYTAIEPFDGSPQEQRARAQRYRDRVSAIALRLDEIWTFQWLPEIEAHWAFWAEFNLDGADMPALLAHLEESLERGARLYELHYLMGPPMWFAIDEFETLIHDLFPGMTTLDTHRMLQGFDNKTLEMGRALWRLRDRAKAAPAVRRIFETYPAEEIGSALAFTHTGRGFLQALRGFLETHGRRSNLWDWGYPSWEDDPTPVLSNLKTYLAQPDRDLGAEQRRIAARRDAAVQVAREALARYPQPVIDRFEQWLHAAQVALVLTENHTYYIDFNGFGWLHRLIREFGKRFTVQGRLHAADDVFYLNLDELRAMAADPDLDLSCRATRQRGEHAYWAAREEPRELGTRPDKPIRAYSRNARRILRYTGAYDAACNSYGAASNAYNATQGAYGGAPMENPAELRGQAGSPGKVRGTARLILSLRDAHRLQPGEILVTTTTAPPWTPLFLTAAAVVTDAGGVLSHSAVVAREYGIPAVVGTGNATGCIQDGQTIEIDGDAGTVRWIEPDRPR
jgi:pyruvate,water dikinase